MANKHRQEGPVNNFITVATRQEEKKKKKRVTNFTEETFYSWGDKHWGENMVFY